MSVLEIPSRRAPPHSSAPIQLWAPMASDLVRATEDAGFEPANAVYPPDQWACRRKANGASTIYETSDRVYRARRSSGGRPGKKGRPACRCPIELAEEVLFATVELRTSR